jgi:hypothetical protein
MMTLMTGGGGGEFAAAAVVKSNVYRASAEPLEERVNLKDRVIDMKIMLRVLKYLWSRGQCS